MARSSRLSTEGGLTEVTAPESDNRQININARKRGNCTSSPDSGTEKRKGTPLPLIINKMTRRTWLRSDVGEKLV